MMLGFVFLDLLALIFNLLGGSIAKFLHHFKAHCDERQEAAIACAAVARFLSAEFLAMSPSNRDTRDAHRLAPGRAPLLLALVESRLCARGRRSARYRREYRQNHVRYPCEPMPTAKPIW
jgi:hypothetical protein